MNEKIIGAIASALSLDASEFTAALKDGDKWLADDELAAKIGDLTAQQVKAAKEAQHKRGQRETWTAIEKRLKAQGFQNEEKLQNLALLDAFFDGYTPENAPGRQRTPVSSEAVEGAIVRIEEKLLALGEREVASEKVGEMVMRELKKLDKVAYVRFASVYRKFRGRGRVLQGYSRSLSFAAATWPLMVPAFSASDHGFMARALCLAERGLYTTTPNPRVGCVVVRSGQIVGEGRHVYVGGQHAEIHALQAAGEKARGATVFVTLEPCSHHGRTPPCAEALLTVGVSRT